MNYYEIIGYVASVLIAISLTMSSLLKLRLINLAGAIFFTAYGLLIQAYPVAAVNFFIILVNLYYLAQFFREKEYFEALSVRPDSAYLQRFLEYHAADIRKFQPDFAYDPAACDFNVFILRDMLPAGLLIGQQTDADSLLVRLDYAIPQYRDLKSGRWLYSGPAGFFRQRGIRKVYTRPGQPAHQSYLVRMGFQPSGDLYCLNLPLAEEYS